ncbi:MAG: hypothetical protein IPJ66_11555 [Bacteroidetes bacterium]|nr:hypothetical protein [Bacteroidota bacterium]
MLLPVDSTAFPLTVPTSVRYTYESDLTGTQNMIAPDTSLTDHEEINPAFHLHYNFLGTLGSAANSQLFRPDNSVYTRPSINTYDLYLFDHDRIKYYKTNKRYSDLSYHNATFREQHYWYFAHRTF